MSERSIMQGLSAPMRQMLHGLRAMAVKFPEHPDVLVSGHRRQTARALERRGLVSVRCQGPNRGWATLADGWTEWTWGAHNEHD